jgi:hypothetical protein
VNRETLLWTFVALCLALAWLSGLTAQAQTITVTANKPVRNTLDNPAELTLEIRSDTGKVYPVIAKPVGDATGAAGREGWTVWTAQIPAGVESVWQIEIRLENYYSLAGVKGIKATKVWITDWEPPTAKIEVKESESE